MYELVDRMIVVEGSGVDLGAADGVERGWRLSLGEIWQRSA